MKAEQYLEQIGKIDTLIENKRNEQMRCLEMASSMGAFSTDERVQSTPNHHKMSDAIDRSVDLENEIKELQMRRARIISTLEQLPKAEYSILYLFYVEGKQLKEVAVIHRKSYSWVTTNKAKALRMLQVLIDEEEAARKARSEEMMRLLG